MVTINGSTKSIITEVLPFMNNAYIIEITM